MNELSTAPSIQKAIMIELKKGKVPSGLKYFLRMRPKTIDKHWNAIVQNILAQMMI